MQALSKLPNFFRVDVFTLVFLFTSVAASFAGEIVFRLFGKLQRDYDHSTYLVIFLMLVLVIIIGFQAKKCVRRNRFAVNRCYQRDSLSNADAQLLAFILIVMFILFLPLQCWYLLNLYSNALIYHSLDFSRTEFQSTIPFVHRLFWYSSFSLGLGFLLPIINKKFVFRSFLILMVILQTIILILYGSKYLLLLPALSSLLVIHNYYNIGLKPLTLLKYFLLFLILVFLATIYTNYRSAGKAFMAEQIFVDIFATFMPEQRDAAYLISEYGECFYDKYYLTNNALIFLASLTHKSLVEVITNYNMKSISQQIFSHKAVLGIPLNSINPRIGIIGSSYLYGGKAGCAVTLTFFVVFLFSTYMVGFRRKRNILGNYFGILIYLNVLWLFNSNFITHLPFIAINIYFVIIFLIIRSILNYIGLSHRARQY
jgi:hypothetical protein